MAFRPHCGGPFYSGKPVIAASESNSCEISIDSPYRTDVKGVYAAGVIATVPCKQIIIAMGEGAKAGLSVFEDSARGTLVALPK